MLDIKINRKDIANFILYFILLFSFFKPDYFNYNFTFLSKIYIILQVLSGITVIALILLKKKYPKIINYILLFLIILLFSTYMNDGNIINCLKSMLQIIILSLIVDYGIKNDAKIFLNSFEFLLFILSFINLITILIYPTGLYTNSTGYYANWFLGYKNTHILFIIPLVLISISNSYFKFNKLKFRNYFVILMSIISTFLVANSTGLVGLLIIILFMVLPKRIQSFKIFNILNYFIVYILSFVSIILLRLQNYFSFFIVNFLHKDLTFTGRTYIWDSVINEIKNKLIFGHGLLTFQYNTNVYTTHNSLLDLLYKTGIIGFASYIIIIYKSLKELYKYRSYKIAKFISIVIFVYFIMMLTEAYSYELIIFIFIFCYNVKNLIHEDGECNE